MKRWTLLFVTLGAACGTGSLQPGSQNSLAAVNSQGVPSPAPAPASGVPDPTAGGSPAPNPNTVASPNTVVDSNTLSNPNAPADPNAGNPNSPPSAPPAKPVFACVSSTQTCTVLGQPTAVSITDAAVLVQLPSSAAASGEVFYAALVSNSSGTVAITRRGAMSATGARIELPPRMPLPTQPTSTVETYKLYVWSHNTATVAYDLAPLVVFSTETPAASWGFIVRPETGAIHGLQAVVDYTKMAAATAPFDRTTLEGPSAFAVSVELLLNPFGNPGSGGLAVIPAGMEIRDANLNVVYTNLLLNGGRQSDNVMMAGQSYNIRLFPQTSLNEVMAGGDPNAAIHFGDIGVAVQGDVEIYNLVGVDSAFYQR